MRRLMGLLASSCLVIAAVAMGGCSSDDPTDPYGNQSVLTGTINGSAWAALTPLAARSGTFVSVFGGDSQDRHISITVTGVSAPGTFSAGPGEAALVELELGVQFWPGTVAGTTGTVVITTLTQTSMTGSFNVTLQPQTSTGATGTRTVIGTFTAYFGQT